MKKYLLVGVVGLLLLTGCGGKKADIVCTASLDQAGIKMDGTYYGYLTDGKVSKVEMEIKFEDEATAKLMCSALQQENEEGTTVKCDGKTITAVAEKGGEFAGKTKEEFVKAVEATGMKCK